MKLLLPFRPLLPGTQPVARLLACLGAAIGISLTMLICALAPHMPADLPVIVPSLGASVVLVFAVPASPLAQPWPVIGGSALSALIGIAMARLIPDTTLAAGAAVGGAILVMSMLRSLHPPGGAAALLAVIGSPAIHATGYGFAFMPVALNSVVLVGIAMVFHRLTGHSYPHRPAVEPLALEQARAAAGFHLEDIDQALAELPDSLDISRADLDLLLSRAELHAMKRRGT